MKQVQLTETSHEGAAGAGRPGEKAPKRRWTSPELVEYGNVVKLTEGGTKSIAADHGANMMRI